MAKVWFMWHGGSGYAAPGYEDIEELESLQAAKSEFRSRLHDSYYPCVSDEEPEAGGPEAWLFFGRKPDDNGDLYPDALMYFGPRGGLRVERC